MHIVQSPDNDACSAAPWTKMIKLGPPKMLLMICFLTPPWLIQIKCKHDHGKCNSLYKLEKKGLIVIMNFDFFLSQSSNSLCKVQSTQLHKWHHQWGSMRLQLWKAKLQRPTAAEQTDQRHLSFLHRPRWNCMFCYVKKIKSRLRGSSGEHLDKGLLANLPFYWSPLQR